MTYNEVIKELEALLSNNRMVKTVKNQLPTEWLYKDDQPVFPVACFDVLSGSLNVGREQVYSLQVFFLDKSGAEAEFERDVLSDMLQVATDLVSVMRGTKRDYTISDNITFNTIRDKYEDYLAGIEISFELTAVSDFDGTDAPLITPCT